MAEDEEDSDTEDLQRLVWGMKIESESSSDEESERSSESGSEEPSLPPDGKTFYEHIV